MLLCYLLFLLELKINEITGYPFAAAVSRQV
jgi:hypothetical protein